MWFGSATVVSVIQLKNMGSEPYEFAKSIKVALYIYTFKKMYSKQHGPIATLGFV